MASQKYEQVDSEDIEAPLESEDMHRYFPKFALFLLGEKLCDAILRRCTKRQWLVLGLLCVASMFSKYDLVIFGVCLKQIQESLSIDDDEVSYVASIVRLGALPAILASIAGDRFGRRKMLIFTLIPYTVFTLLTAFSTDKFMFVVFQFLSRIFIVAELTLSNCTIIEEFDDDNRGWAVGMLGAISALGAGIGLTMFGIIGGHPAGWRIMFVIGVLPLLAISWYRRALPETRSFTNASAASSGAGGEWWRPVYLLFTMYPRRLLFASSFVFVFNFCLNVAGFYNFKFLQERHGFSPENISMLGSFGGFFSVCVYVLAGKLSDIRGRKLLTMEFSTAFFITLLCLYNSPHWFIATLLWVVFMGLDFGVTTIISAFYSELFSTSHRSTAAGMYEAVGVIGLTLGTVMEGAIHAHTHSHWSAISYTSLPGLFAFLLIIPLPETASKDLNTISPEIPV
jgi:MFS family permease